MNTEFQTKLSELRKKIGNHNVMTFSTCAENRVTSRQMSVVAVDGNFYCQTSENFLKYKQIIQNSNVALCFKNFSIEGVCSDVGKPADGSNASVLKAIKKYFPLAYKSYSFLSEERLLKIVPIFVYSWNYEFTKPYMEFWDMRRFTYLKEYKDISV